MRKGIASLTATALAAVTLLAGCGSTGTNNSNATNTATGNTTTTTTTTTGNSAAPTPTSTASPVTSGVTTVSASTPTEAFTAYYEAVKRKDVNAIKTLFSKGTLGMLEERAKRQNTTLDAVIKDGIEDANKEVPESLPQIRNEKVEGDKATLEINDEKKERWVTLNFMREGGQWKISFNENESK